MFGCTCFCALQTWKDSCTISLLWRIHRIPKPNGLKTVRSSVLRSIRQFQDKSNCEVQQNRKSNLKKNFILQNASSKSASCAPQNLIWITDPTLNFVKSFLVILIWKLIIIILRKPVITVAKQIENQSYQNITRLFLLMLLQLRKLRFSSWAPFGQSTDFAVKCLRDLKCERHFTTFKS